MADRGGTYNNERIFYVIKFIGLPFEGIDDYVCVPSTWLVIRRVASQKAVVAYPTGEAPSVTRDRAKRRERYKDDWKRYMAVIKYESNSYNDAEFWLATRKGPVVEETPKETRSKLPVNRKLRGSYQINLSESEEERMKRLIKKLAESLAKKKNEELMKLNEPHPSSSMGVNNANIFDTIELRPQKRKLFKIQDNQSMESESVESSAETTDSRSKITHIEEQVLNSPLECVDNCSEVSISSEDLELDQSISEVNSSSNTNVSTANPFSSEPSTSRCHQEYIRHRSSHSNFKPQIVNAKSLANINDHELVNEVSNQEPSTFYKGLNSLKISALLNRHKNGSRCLIPNQNLIEKALRPIEMESNSVIAAKHSNLIDKTRQLPTSLELPVTIQNQSQNDPQVLIRNNGNGRDQQTQTAPLSIVGVISQESQEPRIQSTSEDLVAINIKNTYKIIGAAELELNATNVTRNVRQEIQFQEIYTNIPSSSNQYQSANRSLKLKRKKFRFVLPSQYNPHDTKWTLKYPNYLPGLVELKPQSGVYISCGDLNHCETVSKDCKSLALRLLPEVFSRNALSVCATTSETARADNNSSDKRPDLDDCALTVLLNFVIENGLEKGWDTNMGPILKAFESKIKEIRFKCGVMFEC